MGLCRQRGRVLPHHYMLELSVLGRNLQAHHILNIYWNITGTRQAPIWLEGAESALQSAKKSTFIFFKPQVYMWLSPPNLTFLLVIVVLMKGNLLQSFIYKHCFPTTRTARCSAGGQARMSSQRLDKHSAGQAASSPE